MSELKIFAMSEVEKEKVDWLWKPFIPKGKITIVQGDPLQAYLGGADFNSAHGIRPLMKNLAPTGKVQTFELDPDNGFVWRGECEDGVITFKKTNGWYWQLPIEVEFSECGQNQDGQDVQGGQQKLLSTLAISNESECGISG